MVGLTDKEIEQKQNDLYSKYYGDAVRIPENLKQEWTTSDSQLMHELAFRSWANSCLIYGNTWKFTEEELQTNFNCIGKSVLKLYNLSLKRALELIKEQEERFKTARVTYGVYTDGEGCSYNSCEWN